MSNNFSAIYKLKTNTRVKLRERRNKIKTETRLFFCKICASSFQCKKKLKEHKSKNECYRFCLKCNIIVRGNINWLKHQLKHSNVLDNMETKDVFTCQYCKCIYKRECAKERHERYKHCFICKRFFNSREMMITHHFAQHDRPWFCTICQCFETRDKKETIQHESHHNCKFCQQKFISDKEGHTKKYHRNEEEQLLKAANIAALEALSSSKASHAEAANKPPSAVFDPPSKRRKIFEISKTKNGTWEVLISELGKTPFFILISLEAFLMQNNFVKHTD